MAEDMRETMSMIRRKAMVYSSGLMEENMKVDGKMVSNTVLVLIHQPVERPSKETGKRVKDLIGFQVMLRNNEGTIDLKEGASFDCY